MKYYQPSLHDQVVPGIFKTLITGLYFMPHRHFPDDRGFFKEVAKIPSLEKAIGHQFEIKQINHSRSGQNTVRGFHAEAWNKLVTITHGNCLCVLADVRPDSDSFLQTEYFLLGLDSPAMHGSLFIPGGVANSVCVMESPVDYLYMVDQLYESRDQTGDVAISLFDPDLNVQWPLPREKMIISNRDRQAITLKQKYPEKFNS